MKEIIEANESVYPNSDLLNSFKTNFPQFFDIEGNFKADKFADELQANNIQEARDGYRLSFVGKDYARLQTGRASETMVMPDVEHNSKPENADSQNVFITGDNLEALRHLQNAYLGKVKMIYIDPPYNTGKEFVYNDRFEFSDEKLKSALGYSDDEIARLKNIQGKSSHSAWLTFMYPRLKLAQKLLSYDGVIFVSIDDNEQANLKLLMDDVFGEDCFAGQIIWQTATDNNPTQIVTEHEYVLCYVKNMNQQDAWEIVSEKGKIIQEKYEELKVSCKNDKETIQAELRKWIRKQTNGDDLSGVSHYSYVDEQGVFYPGNSANTKPGGYSYDIIHPITKKVCAKPEYGYRFTLDTFTKADNNGDVMWGENERIIPKIKKRLDTVTQRLKSNYYEDNRATTAELKALFGGIKVFNNPKSIIFLKHILKFVTRESDLILDFFAGSGTTAHAVMQLNAEDENVHNRKFIMVQLDEPTKVDSEARTAGYNTIDEISRERIKRAATKIKSDNSVLAENSDLGFKHYRLTTPTADTLDKITEFSPTENRLFGDDMVSALGGLDTILATWLIDDGYDFSQSAQIIDFAEYTAHYIDNSVLYLISQGWGTEQTKALLNKIGKHELNVNTIIVFGYSFTMESLRELEMNVKNTLDRQILIEKRY